jgi:hypothetical protein
VLVSCTPGTSVYRHKAKEHGMLSCVIKCHVVLDPASLLRKLWCCHVCRGFGPRLPVKEGFGAMPVPWL